MSYEVDSTLVNSFKPEDYAEYVKLFKEYDKKLFQIINYQKCCYIFHLPHYYLYY